MRDSGVYKSDIVNGVTTHIDRLSWLNIDNVSHRNTYKARSSTFLEKRISQMVGNNVQVVAFSIFPSQLKLVIDVMTLCFYMLHGIFCHK